MCFYLPEKCDQNFKYAPTKKDRETSYVRCRLSLNILLSVPKDLYDRDGLMDRYAHLGLVYLRNQLTHLKLSKTSVSIF
jgi:hypothetical protein